MGWKGANGRALRSELTYVCASNPVSLSLLHFFFALLFILSFSVLFFQWCFLIVASTMARLCMLVLLAGLACASASSATVLDLTPDDFDSVVDGSRAVMVEFFAPWCVWPLCSAFARLYMSSSLLKAAF